jgi:predicted DsbA family dithiol-disulfide isomerase
MTKPLIRIDVVSDVVCPWCYIGKRRLEKAVAQSQNEFNFEIEYHPFELNPDMPEEGRNQKEYLANKFGSEERYQQITNHVTQTAAEEGLKFDFAKQNVSPNTRKAHRLIAFSKQFGMQLPMKEALMSAYFEKGIDLTKNENLLAIAKEVGLDENRVASFLNSTELLAEVQMEEEMNYQRGISGVPFYIINNKYGVSGAQPTDVFMQAFREISQENITTGEACDADSKDC